MKYEITTHIIEARDAAFVAIRKLRAQCERFSDYDEMYKEAIGALYDAMECLSRARSATEFMEDNMERMKK